MPIIQLIALKFLNCIPSWFFPSIIQVKISNNHFLHSLTCYWKLILKNSIEIVCSTRGLFGPARCHHSSTFGNFDPKWFQAISLIAIPSVVIEHPRKRSGCPRDSCSCFSDLITFFALNCSHIARFYLFQWETTLGVIAFQFVDKNFKWVITLTLENLSLISLMNKTKFKKSKRKKK